MKIAVYNLSGKKSGEMEISEALFGADSNNDLVHQVYTVQSNNRRIAIAHTKDRSEVSGSGKKPWAQKGTGNARAGQIRNPIWRGGGVVFGPHKYMNFKRKINEKMRRKALMTVLSDKIRNKKMIVVDELKLNPAKTRQMVKALKNLKIEKSALIALHSSEKSIYLCVRNIPKVSSIPTEQLNVFDLLNRQFLVLSTKSVKCLEHKFKK